MATIRISRGLRKLEFKADGGADSALAQVEFAHDTRLPAGQSVQIPLGSRDGKLRVLIGVPQLIEGQDARSSAREYLYRVTGSISELSPTSDSDT